MKLESPRNIYEKCSDMKFHENPFSGSQFVPSKARIKQSTN